MLFAPIDVAIPFSWNSLIFGIFRSFLIHSPCFTSTKSDLFLNLQQLLAFFRPSVIIGMSHISSWIQSLHVIVFSPFAQRLFHFVTLKNHFIVIINNSREMWLNNQLAIIRKFLLHHCHKRLEHFVNFISIIVFHSLTAFLPLGDLICTAITNIYCQYSFSAVITQICRVFYTPCLAAEITTNILVFSPFWIIYYLAIHSAPPFSFSPQSLIIFS